MVALMSVLKSVTFHVKETATPKSSQCKRIIHVNI